MGWLRTTGHRLSSVWLCFVTWSAAWFAAARLSRKEAARSRRLRRELTGVKRQLAQAKEAHRQTEQAWKQHCDDLRSKLEETIEGIKADLEGCRQALEGRDGRIEELEADKRGLETELSAEQLGVKTMAASHIANRELFNFYAQMHAAVAEAWKGGRE